MENRRFILLALLGVVFFFMYQAWQKDYAKPPAPAASEQTPPVADDDAPPLATVPPPPATSPGESPPAPTASAANGSPTPASTRRLRVHTDLLVAEIALAGGELRRVELKGYPVSKDRPEEDLALLDDRNGHVFILQSGLAGTERALVSHKTAFASAADSYALADGADSLDVPLDYVDASGFSARKIYRFRRGSYRIDVVHLLRNTGAAELTASPYARFLRNEFQPGDEPPFVATFSGVGVYRQNEPGGTSYAFKETAFEDLAEDAFEVKQTGGWIAMLQHYFVSAILPPPGEALTFSAKPAPNGNYSAQYVGPGTTVAPGAEQVFTTGIYVGPKLQNSIGDEAPGLELTVDYNILGVIAKPLFWLLDHFHTLTNNWGVAIILLTLVVKLLMYKLSEAQYRSMAKMKKFAPKIQDIKERYGDDRERMQKAMMELYKKEGFNPLAGCWPLLVQFPVFIALYWVLLESVEMRQAPFALWIQDLSAPDPYFVLPVLFGISMFIQQKLSGQQVADPMQQKIMNVMPIMLTAFFAFFQSGLVLYWFVSNLIGISQQWYITRKLEREELRLAAARR